jgi:hypothetical protein
MASAAIVHAPGAGPWPRDERLTLACVRPPAAQMFESTHWLVLVGTAHPVSPTLLGKVGQAFCRCRW